MFIKNFLATVQSSIFTLQHAVIRSVISLVAEKATRYILLCLLISSSPFYSYAATDREYAISDVVHTQKITIGEQEITIEHVLDRRKQVVVDYYYTDEGVQLDALPIIRGSRNRIDDSIVNHLLDEKVSASDPHRVDVLLNIRNVPWIESYSSAGYRNEDGSMTLWNNDRVISENDFEVARQQQESAKKAYQSEYYSAVQNALSTLISSTSIREENLTIKTSDVNTRHLKLYIAKSDIESLLNRDDLIDWIGILGESEDDIASAMLETRVDPEALSRPSHSGDGIGVYITESTCSDFFEIPNYTYLGGALAVASGHPDFVLGVLDQVSPDSWKYCRVSGGPQLPFPADLNNLNPAIRVINRSASLPDSDQTYDAEAETYDDFSYTNEIAMVQTPGNTGNDTDIVRSPGVALNLITVGNYNDATGNIRQSSPGLDPLQTLNNKPELVAPGTNISVPNATGSMSGTSFAAPHVAGMIANFMENFPGYIDNPYLVKASLIAGARRPVGGDPEKIEEGGVDYLQHVNGEQVYRWRGNSGTFDWLDIATDGVDDEWMEHQTWLSSSATQATFAVSWALRGEYIGDNLTSSQPMGANYDFMVFKPNGAYVGGGWSYHDPYDVLTFDPDQSGWYKIRIRRTSNGDASAKFHMGYAVNWQ